LALGQPLRDAVGYDARRLAVSRLASGSVRLACQNESCGPIGLRYARREFEPVPKNWIDVPVLTALGNGVVVLPERRIASSVISKRSGRENGPSVQ